MAVKVIKYLYIPESKNKTKQKNTGNSFFKYLYKCFFCQDNFTVWNVQKNLCFYFEARGHLPSGSGFKHYTLKSQTSAKQQH